MPPPDAATVTTLPWTFSALGTAWHIDPGTPLDDATMAAVRQLIDDFDATWSRFRPDSRVSRLAVEGGPWAMTDRDATLVEFFADLHDRTGGAVTPLVGRTLADLGYDADYTLRPVAAPTPVAPWSDLGWASPVLDPAHPVLLDVGAAGKGRLVDLVVGELVRRGHETCTVDASGDLFSCVPLRVALEHPGDPDLAVGVVELPPGRALCASAVNRRRWAGGWHHVLDGRTGLPTGDVVATWVVADSCMVADGLATALFFADPAELARGYDFACVRMHADGRLMWSRNLPGEVFG